MRTARSSSRQLWEVCLSACWDTPPMVWAWRPPGCGPGDLPPGVGLETPPGVGLETSPRCGPGDPTRCGLAMPLARPLNLPLGVDLETSSGQTPQLPPWVWAWRPPPPVRPLKLPPGCGPGNLQGMLGYTPAPLETCKACWDTTCKACWDTTPLWTESQTRVKT